MRGNSRCIMAEKIVGGKADGMTLEDIAKKHGINIDIIEREWKMGVKIEAEHSNDDDIKGEIARDHLAEFPTYYTFLEEMEAKAKKDYKAKKYGPKKQEPKKDELNEAKAATMKKLFG
jgi:hypothetical protein